VWRCLSRGRVLLLMIDEKKKNKKTGRVGRGKRGAYGDRVKEAKDLLAVSGDKVVHGGHMLLLELDAVRHILQHLGNQQ